MRLVLLNTLISNQEKEIHSNVMFCWWHITPRRVQKKNMEGKSLNGLLHTSCKKFLNNSLAVSLFKNSCFAYIWLKKHLSFDDHLTEDTVLSGWLVCHKTFIVILVFCKTRRLKEPKDSLVSAHKVKSTCVITEVR